jgi:hypothetical protein
LQRVLEGCTRPLHAWQRRAAGCAGLIGATMTSRAALQCLQLAASAYTNPPQAAQGVVGRSGFDMPLS